MINVNCRRILFMMALAVPAYAHPGHGGHLFGNDEAGLHPGALAVAAFLATLAYVLSVRRRPKSDVARTRPENPAS